MPSKATWERHLPLALLLAATCAPIGVLARVGDFAFRPCNGTMECGYVIAPKNYFDPSDGIANITVARRRATSLPRKGTVFVNPGGPGAPGARWVLENIGHLVDVIGTQWDIAGFDPRGIGSTTPRIHCFADVEDQVLLYANTVFEQGYTIPDMRNHSNPDNFDALVQQQRQHLAIFRAQSESCRYNMDVGDLRFMGTTTVARDVDFMANLLDGPNGKINFYGYSYGTVIASFIINMFPSRTGLVTLDGVVDPITVSHFPTHQWAETFMPDVDGAYEWFLRDCSKVGPKACPLANQVREDPAAIGARIDAFTQSLVADPLPVGPPSPGYISDGAIRNMFVKALFSPKTWPTFSAHLAAAMGSTSNGTGLLLGLQSNTAGEAGGDLSRFGAVCADAPRNASLTPEDYARSTLAALAVSKFTAGLIFTDADGGCEYWPAEPIERFTGPFNATLSHPVLIVSNSQDPVTSLANGISTNARMATNSSTIIIQDGPGHTTLALPSNCTTQNIRAYWAGHVPVNGTVCQLSEGPWPGQIG